MGLGFGFRVRVGVRERLVDGLRLLEGLAGGLRLGEPLGAGEVDEAQLAHVMVARVQVGGAHLW